jgi:hypothetical protein
MTFTQDDVDALSRAIGALKREAERGGRVVRDPAIMSDVRRVERVRAFLEEGGAAAFREEAA